MATRMILEWDDNKPIYQIDEASSTVTYMRQAAGSAKVLIKKITVAGTVTTFEKAFDTWANRAAASYIAIDAEFFI